MGQRIPVTLGNIAPLSLRPFQPGSMALVCEGGGQRGIFTAGVLDEFMRAQFNPFDLFYGTSAGAQNLSAYLCNQPGYGRKVIMRYTTRREFFDPVRFVRGGNHSITAGILAGEGTVIPEHVYDMSWLFELVRTDGNHWFVDGQKAEAVKSGRSAAVFEIGRLLTEGAKNG